jgi:hypothetical protein
VYNSFQYLILSRAKFCLPACRECEIKSTLQENTTAKSQAQQEKQQPTTNKNKQHQNQERSEDGRDEQ